MAYKNQIFYAYAHTYTRTDIHTQKLINTYKNIDADNIMWRDTYNLRHYIEALY